MQITGRRDLGKEDEDGRAFCECFFGSVLAGCCDIIEVAISKYTALEVLHIVRHREMPANCESRGPGTTFRREDYTVFFFFFFKSYG
ncbi:hypothetical protein FKM82_014175 [Ascaphus truei]